MDKKNVYKYTVAIMLTIGFITGYIIGRIAIGEPVEREKSGYEILQEGYERIGIE